MVQTDLLRAMVAYFKLTSRLSQDSNPGLQLCAYSAVILLAAMNFYLMKPPLTTSSAAEMIRCRSPTT